MNDRVEFVLVIFCKLLKAPADRMVKKLLTHVFRRYYEALHAFPRNFDLMSQKSRKRDQKIKKLSADFRFFHFPIVATLSHWYQVWIAAALSCFEPCLKWSLFRFSPSLINQQTLALAAATGLSLPAIVAALSGSGTSLAANPASATGATAMQNPATAAGLNPSAALLSALASGGNCSSQLAGGGTTVSAAANATNPNAALVAALMNSAAASNSSLQGQSMRGAGSEQQNSSHNAAAAAAVTSQQAASLNSQSPNYLHNLSNTHSLVGLVSFP